MNDSWARALGVVWLIAFAASVLALGAGAALIVLGHHAVLGGAFAAFGGCGLLASAEVVG